MLSEVHRAERGPSLLEYGGQLTHVVHQWIILMNRVFTLFSIINNIIVQPEHHSLRSIIIILQSL